MEKQICVAANLLLYIYHLYGMVYIEANLSAYGTR